MAKTTSRLDWYAWYPKDIQSSRTYQRMSAAQRGAYRDMLDECWINFDKGCGIKPDKEWLALAWGILGPEDDGEVGSIGWRTDGLKAFERLISQIANVSRSDWAETMPDVIRMFRVVEGHLVNDRLLLELDHALEGSTNSKIRRLGKPKTDEPKPDSSLTPVPLQSNSSATKREQNNTIENKTEQQSTAPSASVLAGQVLDELHSEDNTAENTSGRKKGQPGFYQRGQYPGTSPKAVFSHIAKAWARIRGAAAVCRYPSKYPESWEMLVDQKSSDLLVPAFELWASREGYNTEWPLTDFIKVAQKYMAEISPLNETKPKLSKEVIAASYEIARQQHNAAWGDGTKPADAEPDGNAFLEEK